MTAWVQADSEEHPGRAVDQVIHGCGHLLTGQPGGVGEHDGRSVGILVVAHERILEHGGGAGIRASRPRHVLVRH
jgi:hypothetical protein